MNEMQKARKEAFEADLMVLLRKHSVCLDLLRVEDYGVESTVLEFDFDYLAGSDDMSECEFFSIGLNDLILE